MSFRPAHGTGSTATEAIKEAQNEVIDTDLGVEQQPILRSSVRLETNAKGLVQTKIVVYEGTSDEEMQRLSELAIRTYEVTTQSLGARTQLN